MRIPLFRIWYSTTYTTIFFVLVLLLAIAPGDTIYQSIRSREFQKPFIVGGAYLLTFLIALLVYSTRLYTNRTVLQAIPKGYVPVEDGEVGKGVRRMVVKNLRRSAIIAWDCRPRDMRGEVGVVEDEDEDEDEAGGDADGPERTDTTESKREKEKIKPLKKKKSHHHIPDTIMIPVSAKSPHWGLVSHPGWASPVSPDLPNLKYWNVICELPNLIEAKAVSLAPPDPAIEENDLPYLDNGPPLPDAHVVTFLQRPRAMGLREYLGRLAEFGLLNPPSLGPAFLAQYEHARFSTSSLTEAEFRDIMAIFADILNGMVALDPIVIDEIRAQSAPFDTRSLAPTESSSDTSDSNSDSPSHPRLPFLTPQLVHRRSVSSFSDTSSLNSNEAGTNSPQSARTAPSRQRHRNSAAFATPPPRTPSEPSLRSGSETGSVMIHATQRRSPSTILPNSSSASSLRSAQSVIRLHLSPGEGELPYQYLHIDGG